MRLLIFIILFFALPSCQEDKKQDALAFTDVKRNHLKDSFGKVGFDTSTFRKLDCGLYINSLGIIAFKAIDNSMSFDSTKPLDVYLTTVYNNDADSPGDDMKEIRLVVDTLTFSILANGHFEDKNYHYQFTPMMDGGTIGISKKPKS